MRFSFTLYKNLSPQLLSLLEKNYFLLSHIYLLNPFSFNRDSEKEHKEKLSFLEELIGQVRRLEIEPVFSLPYTCYGGYELTPEFHRRLLKTLDEISQLGIKAVQVANPYFTEFFRSPFPPYKELSRFRLDLGAGAKITNRVKLLADADIDLDDDKTFETFTVGFHINRSPFFTFYLGQRYIRAGDSSITIGRLEYKVNERWTVGLFGEYDWETQQADNVRLTLTRNLHRWLMRVGIERDAGEDNTLFILQFIPQGLPEATLRLF